MSKITLEDVQVKQALKDVQQSYQRIAELKTIVKFHSIVGGFIITSTVTILAIVLN